MEIRGFDNVNLSCHVRSCPLRAPKTIANTEQYKMDKMDRVNFCNSGFVFGCCVVDPAGS